MWTSLTTLQGLRYLTWVSPPWHREGHQGPPSLAWTSSWAQVQGPFWAVSGSLQYLSGRLFPFLFLFFWEWHEYGPLASPLSHTLLQMNSALHLRRTFKLFLFFEDWKLNCIVAKYFFPDFLSLLTMNSGETGPCLLLHWIHQVQYSSQNTGDKCFWWMNKM